MRIASISKIKQSQLVKISLLVSVLVSLPKTIFIYRMITHNRIDFSEVTLAPFIVQFLFFFLFSWIILQLSANWSYAYVTNKTVRIVVNIILAILILIGFMEVLVFTYPFTTTENISKEEYGFLFFNYATILIALFFVARILRLQIIQKENLIENEQLKQQNLQSELTALKNQIDPHFLFNSLNSLTSLLRENQEATDFVTKLSFMYRYILQSGNSDVVSVAEELKFLDSYLYLIKTRYRNRFTIKLNIAPADLDKKVPPLALQVLVENAVKHNEISESNPLLVEVYSENGKVVIKNKIRNRRTLAEGTGNGLTNLNKRYYLVAKQQLTITTENNSFCVLIPLL